MICDRRERSRYNLYVQRRATGNRGWGRGGGGAESTDYTLGSIIYLRDRAGGSIVTVLFLQSCQIRLVHHPSTVYQTFKTRDRERGREGERERCTCALGVFCCFAFVVCLTLLASFFLPSFLLHLSLTCSTCRWICTMFIYSDTEHSVYVHCTVRLLPQFTLEGMGRR